jgi:hypothetical protein
MSVSPAGNRYVGPVYQPYPRLTGITHVSAQPNVFRAGNMPHRPGTPTPCGFGGPQSPAKSAKKLVEAGALLGIGLLLHRLPIRQPTNGMTTLLPSDWKVWARVLLGISAVHKINQAFDWKLPPWLGALESIAVINPIAVGFSRIALKQTAVMAPLVAGTVQGASILKDKTSKPLQEKWQISPAVTQAGITATLGLAAMLVYPHAYRVLAKSGAIGEDLKQAAEKATIMATTFTTCARGCSPSSFICLSELADIWGSFVNWLQGQHQPKPAAPPSRPLPVQKAPL